MKPLFTTLFALMALASAATYLMLPGVRTVKPVLYWVTDPGDERQEQVRLFEEWLVEQGHPPVDLRIDAANRDVAKKLVQAVSGVGGDLLDLHGEQMRRLQSAGVLEDLTDAAREMGFSPAATFSAAKDSFVLEGRQYAFPRGVYTYLYWVNLEVFRRHGLPPPPREMDVETFERLGKALVAAATPPGKVPTVFFASDINRTTLRRSLGVSMFNETLTRSTLDDPRNVEVYRLIYKWTHQDRIIPDPDYEDLVTSDSTGFHGTRTHLFATGRYALLGGGRYLLGHLRDYPGLELAVVEPPSFAFRNTIVHSTRVGVYTGSRRKDLARLFMAFLASPRFSDEIVRVADGLPPRPDATLTETFRNPPDHPNEWGKHQAFADAAQTIGISLSISPFLPSNVSTRIEKDAYQYFLSGQLSAEIAAKSAAEEMNREIGHAMSKASSELRAQYDRMVKLQEKIDRFRAEGRPVPEEWLANPFHRRYYADMGWSTRKQDDPTNMK